MEMSLHLAQFFGIIFVVFGTSVILKREMFQRVAAKLSRSAIGIYTLAAVEFLAGLSIVMAHNVWVFDWPILITLGGWGALLEGGAYLILPIRWPQKGIRCINDEKMYLIGGVASILFGVFLIGKGFGLF